MQLIPINVETNSMRRLVVARSVTPDESLERGRVARRYEHLVLVAVPQFLGTLRAALGKHVRERVVIEVPHEVTTKAPEEIRACLPKGLGGSAARE
jgi:protein required for attachment to host cells